MFDLSGKNALVTGASGGIGSEIAKALHAQGATVAVSGTRVEALEALAGDLGDRVHVVPAVLGEPGFADKLIKEADEAMGGIGILVNNAGITRDNLAMRMKDEDWQKVIDVNLTSAFQLARGCLRGMMKARWGRIISITSVVGTTGNPGQANYAAAKAGLTGMTKSMAQEVASRGITVNCVAPGFIETPMTDSLGENQKQRLLDAIPSGRLGTPGDVAPAIVYLASDESAYLTGQTLHLNGGMAMI
ncbi:MAG: 3-oxoacyl-[acyl-carrier-protein] reductase [Rhodospirillales bacterium]|nr:3-oxoacyl-[acyl-carrier-protein] reductase [Rhodospirillales bacterium]